MAKTKKNKIVEELKVDNSLENKILEAQKNKFFILIREKSKKTPIIWSYQMDKNNFINKYKVLLITNDFSKCKNYKNKIKWYHNYGIVFENINGYSLFLKDFDLEINNLIRQNFEECFNEIIINKKEQIEVVSSYVDKNKLITFSR